MYRMKRFYIFVVSAMAVVISMFSCTSQKTDAKLLNGRWNITEVKGEKIVTEPFPFMEFNMSENRLYGNAGCNIFNTSFSLEKSNPSAIQIANGATTMMACPDMDLEKKILNSMSEVRMVQAGDNDSEMYLIDNEGKIVLRLRSSQSKD